MAETVLWEKTLDSKYQCKCVDINSFFGKLTVTDTTNNNVLLEKELVLREPLNYAQWEAFCQNSINNS